MPLQHTLLKELCVFHHRKIDNLDEVTKYIRKYFSPTTYRSKRITGSERHNDLYGLSIEEIITFFDELLRTEHPEKEKIKEVMNGLQSMTAELISYLSTNGNPGQNPLLRKFVERLFQTDVLITFNWDTILDRALANVKIKGKRNLWNPVWGYGGTVRRMFVYRLRKKRYQRAPKIPRKYPKFLKLHGSINWTARIKDISIKRHGAIMRGWKFKKNTSNDVVMMPPKMIKPEIWDQEKTSLSVGVCGNDAVRGFYPAIWKEAQEQLERSRRIVFIGYSFPPADFAVGNMIRRAISRMKVDTQKFPEIDIIDPNAAELAKRFEQSFKIPVPTENQYLSLRNYLDSARK